MKKSVLLLGSYGQSNVGDDLLMWNYLELLKDRGYETIYVNTNTTALIPKPIEKKYYRLQFVDTYNTSLRQYIRLIRNVDCIVYGGGTLYKELYASTGRSKYSVITRLMLFNILARLLGTKLYHLNIGIGSLKTSRGRLMTKLAISAATQTVFRDHESYKYAREVLKIKSRKIQESTDGLFLNHIWERPWEKNELSINRRKYKKVIGINVLSDIPDWIDREQYITAIRQYVTKLLNDKAYVVFVPFQHDFNERNDLAFMKETFSDILKGHDNYQIIRKAPIDKITSYLVQCDMFVGMRFHSLLLATAAKVPFVALAYDTKCWRFIEETGYPYALRLEDFTSGASLEKLHEKALGSNKRVKKILTGISQRMYKTAEEDIRKLHL